MTMWWTSVGERVLRGEEWNLFREGLSKLWDDVEISDDDDEERDTTGVTVFDGLRKAERLALMATVARGLSDVDEPCLDLTVLTDATIAAVFAQIRYLIRVEVEKGRMVRDDRSAERVLRPRDLVLAAIKEVYPERRSPLPLADSDDLTEWFSLVDLLLDRILDDRDYLAGNAFLDADPAFSRALKAQLGIPEDYFSAIPSDPTAEALEPIRNHLRRICGRLRAWSRTTVCVLEDSFQGLLIGPCDESVAQQEDEACRLVFKMYVTWTESIDCTYPEWIRLFRHATQDASACDESCSNLNPRQVNLAERVSPSRIPVAIEDGCHAERRRSGWVIVDAEGSCLNEVERFVWSRDEPLFFNTQAVAHAAYLRARGFAEGRKSRYREAMIRLGRPLQGLSRHEEESSLGNCSK
jgi:hypothetical protein